MLSTYCRQSSDECSTTYQRKNPRPISGTEHYKTDDILKHAELKSNRAQDGETREIDRTWILQHIVANVSSYFQNKPDYKLKKRDSSMFLS